MDVKEAVRAAKAYVADVLAEERIFNLGLEEIERDEDLDLWSVTVGFSRPWNHDRGLLNVLNKNAPPTRSYKVVQLRDSDGKVVSMKSSEAEN